MYVRGAAGDGLILEMFEKNSSNPPPLSCGLYGKQQQFRLVRDEPCQRKAKYRLAVARQGEPDPGQRQQAGALGRRPGLAEARIEAVVHHRHDIAEIGMASGTEHEPGVCHVIGLASGPRP
jgi:hypothetical protein